MSAIRRDEDTDNIHSIYVDQWDWEKIILKEDRNVEYLKETVRKVYKALKKTEKYMAIRYDYIEEILPKEIFFITTQELADLYPDKTPKEREDIIAREKGAVFLMEIGDKLASGEPHDGRAPDYDDWHLNGDIIVWLSLIHISNNENPPPISHSFPILNPVFSSLSSVIKGRKKVNLSRCF